jgi:hypothetical protein
MAQLVTSIAADLTSPTDPSFIIAFDPEEAAGLRASMERVLELVFHAHANAGDRLKAQAANIGFKNLLRDSGNSTVTYDHPDANAFFTALSFALGVEVNLYSEHQRDTITVIARLLLGLLAADRDHVMVTARRRHEALVRLRRVRAYTHDNSIQMLVDWGYLDQPEVQAQLAAATPA